MLLVAAPLPMGCDDSGPDPVCVGVAGVWNVTLVGQPGNLIICPDRSVVWTIAQSHCDVTIQTESWDPANGAVGGVSDNNLYVTWSWRQGCHEIHESINVTVDGDTMTGDYVRSVVRVVYGEYCPGGGICGATFSAVRQTP